MMSALNSWSLFLRLTPTLFHTIFNLLEAADALPMLALTSLLTSPSCQGRQIYQPFQAPSPQP